MPRIVESTLANWNNGPFQAMRVGDLARSAFLGEDPEEFVVIENVPIVDEHEMYLEPTEEMKKDDPNEQTKIVKVDGAVLRYIAKNNNRIFDETGDASAITLGHTKIGLSAEEQKKRAPIVGWACNFVVGPFLNTDREAIHARFYIRAKNWEDVKENYPRRSIEILPGRWEIDPIALLGADTPERWLGPLHYSRKRRYMSYRREPGVDRMNDNPMAADKMDQMIAAMFNNPAFLQGMGQIVHGIVGANKGKESLSADGSGAGADQDNDTNLGALLEDADDDQEPMAATKTPPGEEHKPDMKKVKESAIKVDPPEDEEEEEDEVDGDEHTKKKMAASCASGTNGMIPSAMGDKKMDKKKKQYAAEQLTPAALAAVDKAVKEIHKEQQFEQQMADMKGQLLQMQRRERSAIRTAILRETQAQGYNLDVAEELPDVIELDDAAFDKHIERIKKRYQQAPVKIAPTAVADPNALQVGARVQYQAQADPKEASHFARDIATSLMAQGLPVNDENIKKAVAQMQQAGAGK